MAEPNPESFVKVSLPFLGDGDLDDSEFRCLIALESWAWGKVDCWPKNAQIARRCGWVNKGKPSKSKVKRVLVSLEAKGYIKRLVALDGDGLHNREKIVLDRSRVGGSNMDHPGSEMNHAMVQYQTTLAQHRTTPRVTNDPPPVQEQTMGGSKLNPELDSGIDPGINPVHQPPPTGGREASEQFREMLEVIAKLGTAYHVSKHLIGECAGWLEKTVPPSRSVRKKATYARELWSVARGELEPRTLLADWARFFSDDAELPTTQLPAPVVVVEPSDEQIEEGRRELRATLDRLSQETPAPGVSPVQHAFNGLKKTLEAVASVGDRIDLDALLMVARHLDKVLLCNGVPGRVFGTFAKRYRAYVKLGEAVANGYDLNDLFERIVAYNQRRATDNRIDIRASRQPGFYWWLDCDDPLSWRWMRIHKAQKGEGNPYRAIVKDWKEWKPPKSEADLLKYG